LLPGQHSSTVSLERYTVSAQVEVILGQNITLVYRALDLRAVDTRALKDLVGAGSNPVVMDTPEMIVAVYPPQQVIVQIGGQRISVTLQQPGEAIGGVPIWEFAAACDQLLRQSEMLAYDYNYDAVILSADGDVQVLFKGLFVRDQQALEAALGGSVHWVAPRVQFTRGRGLYSLVLEPGEEQRIKVHLNVHFESHDLPAVDQLESSFREEFDYLASTLPELVPGGV